MRCQEGGFLPGHQETKLDINTVHTVSSTVNTLVTVHVEKYVHVKNFVPVNVPDVTNPKKDTFFSSKDKKNCLNDLFSNVDTLSNKWSDLGATLSIENAHVIGLCEIYPKNCFDESVASKLDLQDYEKYLPDKVIEELCYIFTSPR